MKRYVLIEGNIIVDMEDKKTKLRDDVVIIKESDSIVDLVTDGDIVLTKYTAFVFDEKTTSNEKYFFKYYDYVPTTILKKNVIAIYKLREEGYVERYVVDKKEEE